MREMGGFCDISRPGLGAWCGLMILIITRGQRCFTKQKPHAGRRKGRKMPFLSLVTLTFALDIQTCPSEDQTQNHLPCEFGTNPFSGSRDTSYANKKSQHQRQNRILRSSLRVVIIRMMLWNIWMQCTLVCRQLNLGAVQRKGKDFRMSFGFSQCHRINARISVSRSCHTTAG